LKSFHHENKRGEKKVKHEKVLDFKRVIEYWKSKKEVVDKSLEEFVSKTGEPLSKEIAYYVFSDGKRFRSLITFLIIEGLKGNQEMARDLALAVEILHSASLALDDIIDEDLERRGKPSAWTMLGTKRVILVTHYLIPSALQIISKGASDGLEISVKLWKDTSLGAIYEEYGTELDYYSLVDYKTGSLFKLSSVLAVIGSGKKDLARSAIELGKNIGRLYQIADDYVDYLKGKEPRKTGDYSFKKFLEIVKENNDFPEQSIKYYILKVREGFLSLNLEGEEINEILYQLPLLLVYKMVSEVSEEAGLKFINSLNP
jgi:Geranylgeranyl pyrophosphate synthase